MKCTNCQAAVAEDSRFCPLCGTKFEAIGSEGLSYTRTMAEPPEKLRPGLVVGGKYRVLEVVGRGGMGVVYRAEDLKLKRTVALKFLPEEFTRAPEARDRFLREAQAAAALDHTNICPVYEVDEFEGRMYIAMAYIEGRSLKERLAQGPLAVPEALAITLQVAEGLRAAHEQGVVHRDIKPANIMLGRKGQARVMDFGLARLAGASDLTRTMTVVGTVAYMSPEQARGEKVDGRTDIWSLGCTLFEMVAGRRPFEGERTETIIYGILNENPPLLAGLAKDIPAGFQDILIRCLQKDPRDRYPDAGSLIEDLKNMGAI